MYRSADSLYGSYCAICKSENLERFALCLLCYGSVLYDTAFLVSVNPAQFCGSGHIVAKNLTDSQTKLKLVYKSISSLNKLERTELVDWNLSSCFITEQMIPTEPPKAETSAIEKRKKPRESA